MGRKKWFALVMFLFLNANASASISDTIDVSRDVVFSKPSLFDIDLKVVDGLTPGVATKLKAYAHGFVNGKDSYQAFYAVSWDPAYMSNITVMDNLRIKANATGTNTGFHLSAILSGTISEYNRVVDGEWLTYTTKDGAYQFLITSDTSQAESIPADEFVIGIRAAIYNE